MNARFTPAIIYSEAFNALDWASADLQLDTLPNRPQSVPCRLHVHNGSGGVQNLYLVTKGGIRSTYACPPGAFPYPIDIRAQKIGFGSGANLTVTADWPHDGISADFISHPSQVEGLKFWAGDTVTGAGTAGFNVRDLSGNGNHGTQATTAAQPTPSGGVLTFDGGDYYDVVAGAAGIQLSGATKFALVFRCTVTNTAAVEVLARDSAAPAAINFAFAADSGSVRLANLFVPGVDNLQFSANFTTESAISVVYDGATIVARHNGVIVDSGAATAAVVAHTTLSIGGPNLMFNGSMRNVFIVTGRAPTEAELQYLENYGV